MYKPRSAPAQTPQRKLRRPRRRARRTRRRRIPPKAGRTALRLRPGRVWFCSSYRLFLSCCGSKRTPPRTIPGVVPVGVFDVEHQLFPARLAAAGAALVGQAGPCQRLDGVVQVLLVLEGVELHPVAEEKPE